MCYIFVLDLLLVQAYECGTRKTCVCLQNRAKEARQDKQLAEATGAKFSGQSKSRHSRDSVTPSNTLCFCAIK